MVECQLPKLKVAGSNPVSRSFLFGEGKCLVRAQGLVALLTFALVSLTACQPDRLGRALQGELPAEESNAVILEYCRSCHIHRAFDPTHHISHVQALYDRPPYNVATECRACHLVREDTWGMKRRKTLWPAQVAQEVGSSTAPRQKTKKPLLRRLLPF